MTDAMTHPYAELREALEKITAAERSYAKDADSPPTPWVDAKIKYVNYCNASTAFNTIARNELPKLLKDYDRMREALVKAIPILQENYRWHRDSQSASGRISEASDALEFAQAALQGKDE